MFPGGSYHQNVSIWSIWVILDHFGDFGPKWPKLPKWSEMVGNGAKWSLIVKICQIKPNLITLGHLGPFWAILDYFEISPLLPIYARVCSPDYSTCSTDYSFQVISMHQLGMEKSENMIYFTIHYTLYIILVWAPEGPKWAKGPKMAPKGPQSGFNTVL